MHIIITILILFFALLFSAFFSGSEVALVSTTNVKAKHFAEQGLRGSQALLHLKERPKRMIITLLIGNNIVNIGASAIATKLAIDLFSDVGVGIATGVMTLLILTFGEIAPKTFATKNPQNLALRIAPIILFLQRALFPLVWFFLQTSKIFENKKKSEPFITEQELHHIIAVGEEEGQIKPDEKKMIQRVFELDDTEVCDIMTPRTEMFALEQHMSISEAIPLISTYEFSRVPVYDEDIDRIKGVIFARDLLQTIVKKETTMKLEDLMQPVIFVPEHKKIDKLMKELQRKKTHLAIVVNEHGGVEGLVTIEDILEELVGEIFDESDEVENLLMPKGDNQWLALGKTPLEMINEELDLKLQESDDYSTLAGFIHAKLGRIPKQDERCKLKKEKVDLFIKRVEGPMILEVLIKKNN
jgi:CBS domain containing-hemolysin-like protein